MMHGQSLQPELLRWCERHAAAMALAAALTACGLPLWVTSLCAGLSFAGLLHRCRGRWTPDGRFGPANALTLLRLSGVLALPWLSPFQIFCAGLILFALDGADGWLARRTALAGEFGEFFDKESDALFVLMLCLLLYRLPDGFGAWILLPGLLRYLFVLFIRIARPPEPKERRSAKSRWILVLVILSLLFPFAAYPDRMGLALLLAALATLLLAYSFADSVYRLYRGATLPEKA
jgi:phosphatidylglycerophosphate synthase